jgi:hypothetical protein
MIEGGRHEAGDSLRIRHSCVGSTEGRRRLLAGSDLRKANLGVP